jgi:hypothetical protein
LRIANRLAGNPDGSPALEMTLTGGTFRFDAPACVAIAGADMQARSTAALLRSAALRTRRRASPARRLQPARAPGSPSAADHRRSVLAALDPRPSRPAVEGRCGAATRCDSARPPQAR